MNSNTIWNMRGWRLSRSRFFVIASEKRAGGLRMFFVDAPALWTEVDEFTPHPDVVKYRMCNMQAVPAQARAAIRSHLQEREDNQLCEVCQDEAAEETRLEDAWNAQ